MKKVFKSKFAKKLRWPKLAMVAVALLLISSAGAVYVANRYKQNLRPVNAVSAKEEVVPILSGSSLDAIARILKANNVIRDEWSFRQYVRSHEQTLLLQAGTYRFSTSQDVASIVDDLVKGRVDAGLFTIFPAQRLDEIRAWFIKEGFSASEVDAALSPANYTGHPALTDKPRKASLEGYLYPDSYEKVAQTTPRDIIKSALDEMAEALTPDVRAGIAKQGLSVHEGIIIASIVENEIPGSPAKTSEDRNKAAQVFLKRIKDGMQLGSDVTACYGAVKAGVMKDTDDCNDFVLYESSYNTRLHDGLPPGPISNTSRSSLHAVLSPASTDYLYFVAGDDGVTYFSHTLEEHEKLAAKHCKVLCGR